VPPQEEEQQRQQLLLLFSFNTVYFLGVTHQQIAAVTESQMYNFLLLTKLM
jgi:hypothetical protein